MGRRVKECKIPVVLLQGGTQPCSPQHMDTSTQGCPSPWVIRGWSTSRVEPG